MCRRIFVSLPVRDLATSVAFYRRLGFPFHPGFTDERAACLVVNDTAFVMLVPEDIHRTFTPRQAPYPIAHREAVVAVSARSRQEVDEMVVTALAGGGGALNDPVEAGATYGWSFHDLDGHAWEVIHVDHASSDGRR